MATPIRRPHDFPLDHEGDFRADSLADLLDAHRGGQRRSPEGADKLAAKGDTLSETSGRKVQAKYGMLLHYTRALFKDSINKLGLYPGAYLTPTPYSACVAPCALGLPLPTNLVVLVKPGRIRTPLYGPALARQSRLADAKELWPGGGIEFLSPHAVPRSAIVGIVEVGSCGDAPWEWVTEARGRLELPV